MIKSQGVRYLIPVFIFLSCFLPGMGQPTLTREDLQKPSKYESKVLKAEKTGDKKFTLPRRFFQNTYTHYNYYFNARTKLDQVLENARSQHMDRYGELLPFYNYTLENTSSQRTELDSVIYKVNAGVFLHDLRSDWMDNLYLLLGQAYYYRNSLDSAFMTFQYMNYAFSPKEEDGFDKVIASNSNEGGNVLKVSTVENRNIINRAFSEPPSRNDALVWLIRTQISQNELNGAATLIQTLRNDPTFPERLEPQLAEVTAFWFYQRGLHDSAAHYLELALPAAGRKKEQARWEFLLGQLYGLAGKPEASREAYERCIRHTLDPVMEVAAQLQAALQFTGTDDLQWQNAVAALEKMARREKYADYRDLIYFTIGQIEVQHDLLPDANRHLLKSVQYAQPNSEQKARSYHLLADISFNQRDYPAAKRYYDSVETNQLPDSAGIPIEKRKEVLTLVTSQLDIIHRQDSLQALAALPEAERNALLKKELRQLRRQKGLQEEPAPTTGAIPGFQPATANAPADLFAGTAKGDFYFYNNALKSRGFTEFRTKWGNRPNADNWRRSSTVNSPGFRKETTEAGRETGAETAESTDPSLEALRAKIPLTPEAMQVSNDSILQAGYTLALALQNQLEDFSGAAARYEELLERFPANAKEADILFNLSICYRMLGRTDALTATRQKLATAYPGSRQSLLATNPEAVRDADSAMNRQATQTYDRIYDQFLSGNFEAALAAKKTADSSFGKHYWTPQLLYIEAVYRIKQRDDSLAISVLSQISGQFPDHALAEKARNLADVVKRRTEIESHLNQLEVVRKEDPAIVLPAEPTPPPIVQPAVPTADTGRAVRAAMPLPRAETKKPLSDSTRLTKTAPVAPATNLFSRHAGQPHLVVIVLNEVDPVFVNETRNAFNRYNREKYYGQSLNASIVSLSDQVKMVSITGLPDEKSAMEYITRARDLAPKEIIPWLKADKYYFMPVAEDNMKLLMDSKNLPAYRDFLKQLFPGQF